MAWSPRNLAHPQPPMLCTARGLHTLGLRETHGRAGSYSPRPLVTRPLPIEKLGRLACQDCGRSGPRFAQQEGTPAL